MRTRVAVVALLLLPLLPAAPARTLEASDPVEVTALAVAQTSQGYVGVSALVRATALAGGSGQVFVETKPLAQTDMQGSARQASKVAASLLGLDWEEYDYLVVFRSDSPVIGGPSAGGVMTLALATALWNLEHPDDPWVLDAGVAATGTINPDGTVGPVGGVPAKAEGAAEAGKRLFLYPAGLERASTLTAQGQVFVDMGPHCERIGIECRPIATVHELIEAAAGVRLPRPDVATPSTSEYAELLRPRVEPDVARLEARIAAARDALGRAAIAGAGGQQVEQALATAEARLEDAREALADERFYTTATMTFQGHIQVAYAENLTRFHAGNRDGAVVGAAVAECGEAVAAARAAVAGLAADDVNALYAVGAAQRRVAESEDLWERADAAHRGAFSFDQWLQALFDAAFCNERAQTARWWGGLRDLFGPGPAVDAAGLLQDTLADAQEMVTYATAVLGDAPEARAALDAALEHQEAGQDAAAVLAAVEAQVDAGVAMQAGVGAAVSAETLSAAEASASRAVALARAADAEPFVSVAQLELAGDLTDVTARLDGLWTARSLALLAVSGPAAATEVERTQDAGLGPVDEQTVSAALLAVALTAGVFVLALAGAVLRAARRP